MAVAREGGRPLAPPHRVPATEARCRVPSRRAAGQHDGSAVDHVVGAAHERQEPVLIPGRRYALASASWAVSVSVFRSMGPGVFKSMGPPRAAPLT